jgi:class 3 adenylate cyclase
MNNLETWNRFLVLVDELTDCPSEERCGVERRIWSAFEADRAVLALDMSGYSSSVRRDGILTHLCKIRRMQRLAGQLIERSEGEVVRQLADNILAVFMTPRQAIEAALAINQAIRSSQREDPENDRLLTVAIGIDHGKMLLVPGHDCFGDAVNIAFKLGEDVAGAGEILITQNAMQRLDDPEVFLLQELSLTLSGVEVFAQKLVYYEPA